MTVSIRRARLDDVDFLHELTMHEDVDPFLGASRDRSRDAIVAEVERSEREPERFCRFVIEVDGTRAGSCSSGSTSAPRSPRCAASRCTLRFAGSEWASTRSDSCNGT
jgi:hypothetical protein